MIETTTPELPAERCGNCAMARPADDASGILHAAGWLHCEHQRAWEFVSPRHGCHFDPPRWLAKPERKP
jgi:hypothetical protein